MAEYVKKSDVIKIMVSSMGQYIICRNSGTQLYKRTIMLNGISSSAVCWITCTLMRRS